MLNHCMSGPALAFYMHSILKTSCSRFYNCFTGHGTGLENFCICTNVNRMESPRLTESTHVTSFEEGDGSCGSKGNLALRSELRVLQETLLRFGSGFLSWYCPQKPRNYVFNNIKWRIVTLKIFPLAQERTTEEVLEPRTKEEQLSLGKRNPNSQ